LKNEVVVKRKLKVPGPHRPTADAAPSVGNGYVAEMPPSRQRGSNIYRIIIIIIIIIIAFFGQRYPPQIRAVRKIVQLAHGRIIAQRVFDFGSVVSARKRGSVQHSALHLFDFPGGGGQNARRGRVVVESGPQLGPELLFKSNIVVECR